MEKALNVERKERNYHLVRRQNPSPSFKFGVRTAAVLASFLIIIILFTLIGKFQFGATISYATNGAFGNIINTRQTLLSMMMLLILALGLTPAFKMKFWNTGALGQALLGNICSSLVVFYLGPYISNNVLLLMVAFVAAILGGGLWGVIPGIFKAKLKANETLFTLMLNYVAIQLVKIFVEMIKGGQTHLPAFKYGAFDPILGSPYAWSYIIVGVVAIFIYIYLKYTKHGYEISVVGESFNTAKYAGIDTTVVTIRTSLLSGAICGICGFIFTASSNTLTTASDGGFGFTSIIVAWSSHFSVLAMIVVALLVAFLKKGAEGIKNKASGTMNDYATYIAVGIFLFFLIGCEFFLNYKFAPNSKIAKLQEEKKQAMYEKHPTYCRNRDLILNGIKNFLKKIDSMINKVKDAIVKFLTFIFGKIGQFFKWIGKGIKSIFTKKNKEAK